MQVALTPSAAAQQRARRRIQVLYPSPIVGGPDTEQTLFPDTLRQALTAILGKLGVAPQRAEVEPLAGGAAGICLRDGDGVSWIRAIVVEGLTSDELRRGFARLAAEAS